MERIIHYDQLEFVPIIQDCFHLYKNKDKIHHINRMKKENHIIILTDREKSFYKTKHSIMIKTLSKLGIEGDFLNLIKTIYKKPKLTSYLMVRNSKLFQ